MREIQGQHITKQQTIEICGTSLIVACAAGIRYLSVSAICKALKIDQRTQLRRIRNTEELSGHLRQLVLHFLSGGPQPVYCLPVEIVEPWLSSRTGLQPDTVKPPHQPLLQTFRQDLLRIVDEVCPLPHPLENPFRGGKGESSRALVVSDTVEEGMPIAAQHVLAAQLPLPQEKPRLVIPVYTHAEHTAFREASVAKSHRWIKEEDSEEDPYFLSPTTNLQVYVSRPSTPIGFDAAMRHIAELGPSTVLAARIAFGLWNARRNNPIYAESGWVAIQVEEFFLLRHLRTRTRVVSSDSNIRVSDGAYDKKFLERLQRDLELLNGCHIRRWVSSDNYYDSPYLRVSMLMERIKRRGTQEREKKEKDRLVRVAVSPGEWMPTTYHHAFDRFTHIDERIISLSLKTDVNAILLSLYLTERWRQQALQDELAKEEAMARGAITAQSDPLRPFREPIRVRDLLALSIIDIDYTNLTSRFAPRIEEALQKLFEHKVLAEPASYLTPIDKTHNWGEAWLDTPLCLLPLLDTEADRESAPWVGEEIYQLSLIPGPVGKKRRPRRLSSR